MQFSTVKSDILYYCIAKRQVMSLLTCSYFRSINKLYLSTGNICFID